MTELYCAPMNLYSNFCYRHLLLKHQCDYVFTEMILVKHIENKSQLEKIKTVYCYEDKKITEPSEKSIGEELERAIARAMTKLSKKEAKSIALFGFEGLSHREVAEIIGCSVESVRWYVFRARQKLRVLLKETL